MNISRLRFNLCLLFAHAAQTAEYTRQSEKQPAEKGLNTPEALYLSLGGSLRYCLNSHVIA
jgi:hypothetical protein